MEVAVEPALRAAAVNSETWRNAFASKGSNRSRNGAVRIAAGRKQSERRFRRVNPCWVVVAMLMVNRVSVGALVEARGQGVTGMRTVKPA